MKIKIEEWPSGTVNVGQPFLLGIIEAEDASFVGEGVLRIITKTDTSILRGIEAVRRYVLKND